jgi:hypothetical protein
VRLEQRYAAQNQDVALIPPTGGEPRILTTTLDAVVADYAWGLNFRVPVPDGEQLYVALKRLSREVALVRYPREGHDLSRSGEPRHRVDRIDRIVEWFDAYT